MTSDRVEALIRFLDADFSQRGGGEVPGDEEALTLVSALSPEEASRLASHAAQLVTAGRAGPGAMAASYLACFFDVDLDEVQRGLVACGVVAPAHLFRGAPPDVVEELLALTSRVMVDRDVMAIHGALAALGWSGDPGARALIASLDEERPELAQLLRIAPSIYGHYGGTHGERELVFDPCFALVPGEGEPSPAGALTERGGECNVCGGELTVLLDLDLTAPELGHLRPRGRRLRLPLCSRCSRFGTTFYDVDPEDGSYSASPLTAPPSKVEENISPFPIDVGLVLGPRRPPRAAVDWSEMPGLRASQVGGHPSWVHRPAYPTCPKCGMVMRFVGQVSLMDVDPFWDGLLYGFVCPMCKISGAGYQQY